MEEDKADKLYRAFRQTDLGARFKQGLGFSAHGQSSAGPVPTSGSSFLAATFRKAGEGSNVPDPCPGPVRQAQATASSPGSSRAAAARVAAKLAELKKEKSDTNARCQLKRSATSTGSDEPDPGGIHGKKSRDGSGARDSSRDKGSSRGKDGSSGRNRDSNRDRPRSRERANSRGRDRSKGRDRSRSRDRDRSRGRNRSRDRSRDRASSRGRDRSRGRGHGRSRSREARDRHEVQRQPLATPSQQTRDGPDWARLIADYDSMSAAQQLRAHTRYNLSRAERQGRDRARDEAWEARRDDDRKEGSARPWTRFVFDGAAPLEGQAPQPQDARQGMAGEHTERIALLDSDSALNSISFASDARTVARQQRDTDHATAIFGAAQPGLASRPSPPAASDPRPRTSPSRPPSAHPSSQPSSHHPHPAAPAMGKSSEELGAGAVGGRVWGTGLVACLDEDGPVVVEEGGCGLISWAEEPQGRGAALQGGGAGMLGLAVNTTGKQEAEEWVGGAALARMPGLGQSRGQGQVLLAGEVEARPAEQSWRDRARQARAAKLAAEEQEAAKAVGGGPGVPAGSSSAEAGLGEEGGGGGEPLQPAEARAPLALTWRDRAKARARPSLPGSMSAGV